MSGAAGTNNVRGGRLTATGMRRMASDRPLLPLIGLLAILVLAIEIVQPGIVNPGWAGVILRTAVPLAILAGCQTLTMLTGGIDLSVGAVASMSGFVVATLVHGPGTPAGIAIALVIAALCGLVTGIGVGVFRVHPLIMTLGMGLVVLGLRQRVADPDGPDRDRCPRRTSYAGVRHLPRDRARSASSSSSRSPS